MGNNPYDKLTRDEKFEVFFYWAICGAGIGLTELPKPIVYLAGAAALILFGALVFQPNLTSLLKFRYTAGIVMLFSLFFIGISPTENLTNWQRLCTGFIILPIFFYQFRKINKIFAKYKPPKNP